MNDLTVVVVAPYSIPLSDGHHVRPGEVFKTERTPVIVKYIAAGKLSEIKTVAPPVVSKERKPKDSQETE